MTALSKRRHVAALQSAIGAAYSDDVAPERSFGIFCDAFLQRCQPYGLPVYTFNNSRQAV